MLKGWLRLKYAQLLSCEEENWKFKDQRALKEGRNVLKTTLTSFFTLSSIRLVRINQAAIGLQSCCSGPASVMTETAWGGGKAVQKASV